jgi:hypothetical protein
MGDANPNDKDKNQPPVDKGKEEEEELGCCAKCWYGYCAIVAWTCKVTIFLTLVYL